MTDPHLGKFFRRNRSAVRLLVLNLCVVMLAAFPGCARMEASPLKKQEQEREGGGCRYISYEGAAEIIRIRQTPESISQSEVIGGPGYKGYEVWFRFAAGNSPLDGSIQKVTGREHLFTLYNSWYVGPRFLEKYGIKIGNKFSCTLKVLVEGTCSPYIFEFPTIDSKDYFESRS